MFNPQTDPQDDVSIKRFDPLVIVKVFSVNKHNGPLSM